MKTIKYVWLVYSTNDEYGRYDVITDLRGVYENKEVAEQASEGVGWYGGKGAVVKQPAVRSSGEWWLSVLPHSVKLNTTQVNLKESLRKKALSKLTLEERRVLGL